MSDEKSLVGPLVLENGHDCHDFSCGEPELDEYLKRYALSQQKRGVGRTYVGLRGNRVVGYYTLALRQLQPEDTTEAVKSGYGNYPVPVVLLGRLAADARERGQGIGAGLLKHAMLNVVKIADLIGVRAMYVEAKHEQACQFYKRYGFEPGPRDPLKLFMMVKTVRLNLG